MARWRRPRAARRRPRTSRSRTPRISSTIGQPLKRLDTPDKVNGKAVYGIDAMLPGMKFATLAQSPVFGGKVGKVDDSAAKKIPGVRQIVVLDDLVAVVGDHMWAAKKGLEALEIDWNEGPNAKHQFERRSGTICAPPAKRTAWSPNPPAISPRALPPANKFEASFELPFLAHATMEPMNATVHCKPDSCEVWTGTQIMARVQSEAAKAAGLPVEKVTVNQHLLGGGFGRKLEPDMVVAAVRIAKQVDGPVKVVWTREEDIQHDVYRPVYRDTIAASLSGGKIVGWKYKIAGAAIIARWLPPAFQKGIDIDAIDSAVDMPYDIPEFPRRICPGRTAGGADRVLARRRPQQQRVCDRMLHGRTGAQGRQGPGRISPRHAGQASRASCRRSTSPRKNPAGASRCRRASGAASACSRRSAASSPPWWKRRSTSRARSICAASPRWSIPASPSIPIPIMAQVEGGLIFGLTAALYGEITIDKGRVQQSNFHDYRMLRIDQAPKIEVHVIKSGEAPGGIGETGTTAGPPALRNAIYAATGVALRRLPIDRTLLAAGKKA